MQTFVDYRDLVSLVSTHDDDARRGSPFFAFPVFVAASFFSRVVVEETTTICNLEKTETREEKEILKKTILKWNVDFFRTRRTREKKFDTFGTSEKKEKRKQKIGK